MGDQMWITVFFSYWVRFRNLSCWYMGNVDKRFLLVLSTIPKAFLVGIWDIYG